MSAREPEPRRLPNDLVRKLQARDFVLRAPITRERRDQLVAAAGPLPEGLSLLLDTSDGLDHPGFDRICGSEEMVKPYPSNQLLPLTDDGCGNYDCVFIRPGIGFGAVVFFDHEGPKVQQLLASSVLLWLERLVRSPGEARWPSDVGLHAFDEEHDPAAARLLADPSFVKLVGRDGPDFTPERDPVPPPGAPLPPGARVLSLPSRWAKNPIVLMPAKPRRPPTG